MIFSTPGAISSVWIMEPLSIDRDDIARSHAELAKMPGQPDRLADQVGIAEVLRGAVAATPAQRQIGAAPGAQLTVGEIGKL